MTVSDPATRRTADPRPVVVQDADGPRLAGGRCTACGHPSALDTPRCSRCAGGMEAARFGPDGVIWATTTIRVDGGGRSAPYTLAYVDLDCGPRVLAHLHDGPALAPRVAERVRLVGRTPDGDPDVELVR